MTEYTGPWETFCLPGAMYNFASFLFLCASILVFLVVWLMSFVTLLRNKQVAPRKKIIWVVSFVLFPPFASFLYVIQNKKRGLVFASLLYILFFVIWLSAPVFENYFLPIIRTHYCSPDMMGYQG